MELPKSMRIPRNAKPISGCDEAWYYVEPKRIVVVAQVPGVMAVQVRLTKKQLEHALNLMNSTE